MYIDIIPNRKSAPAILLRESKRVGRKTIKTTIANLSNCPPEAIEAFRVALRGVEMVPKEDVFHIQRSIPHGHVQAVHGMMKKLKIDQLLASRPSPERDLIMAMIAQQIIHPCSKLATTRHWNTTTLSEEFKVKQTDSYALYDALDWLLKRQSRIEKKLACRHLQEGAKVLFDVSSSSYYGHSCILAAYGYNRDGKKLPSIVYGLLTDDKGRPVAVDVYPGNTADPKTVSDQVDKLRQRFGLKRVVLVGDRGMLTQTQIDTLKEHPGLGWISALRFSAIRDLAEAGEFQPSLFDQYDLAEISSDKHPGERLMVCYNPLLAADRKRTRQQLLQATETALTKLIAQIERRTKTPMTKDEIGVRVGKIISRHKMGKHFILTIEGNHLSFEQDAQSIKRESDIDGIYVVRTSEDSDTLSAEDTVRTYKSLGQVEQAFRCIKSIDLQVRPIRHHTEDHVRAHIFLCMLAYYIQWHMKKLLAPALFQDEELDVNRWNRDAVAKAQPSPTVQAKKSTKKTSDGWPAHSFDTLLSELATRCKNICRAGEGKTMIQFEQLTEPTDFQSYVFQLLGLEP